MIENLQDDHIRPLYHYTTMEAFYNIIDKGEFLISKNNYLNDPLEYTYAKELFEKLFLDNKLSLKINLSAISAFVRRMLDNSYILSLCKSSDNLFMWSNYTKFEGVCLHFSLIDFSAINFYLKNNFDIIEHSVIYDKNEQIEIFNKLINECNNYKGNDEDELFHKVFEILVICFCMFKQEGFKNEEEYRFVIINQFFLDPPLGVKDLDLNFRIRDNLIIPSIKIPLHHSFGMEGITLSPKLSNRSDIKESLAFFMKSKKIIDPIKDNIYDSKIILR